MDHIWIHTTIIDDIPEDAVFGEDTYGIVDENEGGIILFCHKDSAQRIFDALTSNRKDT